MPSVWQLLTNMHASGKVTLSKEMEEKEEEAGEGEDEEEERIEGDGRCNENRSGSMIGGVQA